MTSLVEISALHSHFTVKAGPLMPAKGVVRAVDGVDLSIKKGETLGLVGESGCGKSTLGRAVLGLRHATQGTISFEGEPLHALPSARMKALRREMQLIFQDPYSALDPRRTVGSSVRAALDIHAVGARRDRQRMVEEIFHEVGLRPEQMDRFPHEFSGGQLQRIVIARALILNPKFVVCDEPVSALDVSIQAQILNLLKRLQASHGLTYLFISHNLSVVDHMADRVAVMYYGRIVEIADRETLFAKPRHPYTRALMAAIPQPDPTKRTEDVSLVGEPPDPMNLPTGCRFRNRCPYAIERCASEEPELLTLSATHRSACWRNDDLETSKAMS